MTAVCDSASFGVTSCEVGVGDQSVTASAGSRLRRSRERGKGGGGHVDRQEAVAEIPELRGDSGHEKRGIKREVETLRREDAEKDFHFFFVEADRIFSRQRGVVSMPVWSYQTYAPGW